MQYLYTDGDLYYIMDNETYEQMGLTKEQMGDALDFIQENMNVTIVLYNTLQKIATINRDIFIRYACVYTDVPHNTHNSHCTLSNIEIPYRACLSLFFHIQHIYVLYEMELLSLSYFLFGLLALV